MLLLLGRRTKGYSACCFHPFLQDCEEGFFDVKGQPIKAGQITEPNGTYQE